MQHRWLALLFLSFLTLASCADGDRVYEKHCKKPPSNWYLGTEADKYSPDGGGVISPNINVMELRNSGTLKWNGYSISKKALKGYLATVGKLQPKPMLLFRIENGTSCDYVERVRKIMLDAAICQASEQYCTENSYFEEPPPPSEGVESRKD